MVKRRKRKTPLGPSNLKSRLKSLVRRFWWQNWPARRECLRKANGVCESCQKKSEKLYADHIHPVVPKGGWPEDIYWSMVVHLTFFGELQALCKRCHDRKTKNERK